MQRTASARWQGGAQDGSGTLTTQSGTLADVPFTFKARFGDGKGTNPEELIAVAHAGCFSMALSAQLTQAGHPPTRIHTTARVHLEKVEGGFAIPKIDLVTEAEIPGIDAATFEQVAQAAKAGCPVSKALAGTEITLQATLL